MRLAAATGTYICFEDEAGQNLRPPKARTWAPRGHIPVTVVSGKGSGRVSVAGLTCYRPRERSRLFYRVRVHRGRKGERRSMSEADYASLITAAHQRLSAPVILIWDNLNTHISAVMRRFIEAHPEWLTEVRLPAYAPHLNPVEGAWANMKNSLGNRAARNVDQLTAIVKNQLADESDQGRTPAFFSRQITPVRTALATHHSNDLTIHGQHAADGCRRVCANFVGGQGHLGVRAGQAAAVWLCGVWQMVSPLAAGLAAAQGDGGVGAGADWLSRTMSSGSAHRRDRYCRSGGMLDVDQQTAAQGKGWFLWDEQ